MASNPDKTPYQPWRENDFLADEKVRFGMSHIQVWMYRALLAAAWVNSRCPYLPNDDDLLWGFAGCESKQQWVDNKGPILKCFTIMDLDGDEVLAQKRILLDWENAEARCRSLSERGRRGGRATAKRRVSADVETVVTAEKPVGKVESVGLEFDNDGVGTPVPANITATYTWEEEMRAVKDIRILCRSRLGLAPDPEQFSSWKDLRELVAAFDNQTVIDAFETWAADQDPSEMAARSKYPVSEFCRVATGLCAGTIRTEKDARLDPLIIGLVTTAQGQVAFDSDQTRQVGRLLEKYEPQEILSAFRTFFGQVEDDPFKLRRAAQKFPEQAAQLIEYERRVREAEAATRKQMETQTQTLRAAADLEAQEREAAAAREREAAEEGL